MIDKDKSKKIAILLPDLRGGGAERVNLTLAYEFARVGHHVEFVLMQAHGEFLEEAQSSFSVVDLGSVRVRSLPLTLARYVRQRRPDALLAAMWPLTVVAPVAVQLSGFSCSVLVSEHGILSSQYRQWGRMHRWFLRLSMGIGYRLANHRVGVSSGLVQDISNLASMRPGGFHVIHNPVPPCTAQASDVFKEVEALWSAPKGARIVTVGSMKAVKNHPLLLRAFALLDRPDARLMFVGDGAGRAALLSLARELGLTDRVTLAGFHPDPTPFYESADLFVLSSDYEGFGNVIVEALASGTPVVSTNCPSGPAEILENGRFGRLVPVGDADALSKAMGAALEQPVDRAALKRRATDFSPEIAACKYLDLLDL